MFGRLGTGELILILFVALLVLGPKRLPEAGRAFGKALQEFRQATKDATDSIDKSAEDGKDEKEA